MQKINPPALFEPLGAQHVHVTVMAPTSKIAFIAGQVAFAKNGDLIGKGDLKAQCEQCFANVRDALPAINAAPKDIAKLTIYVVDYKPDQFPIVAGAGATVFGDEWPVTATALFGVTSLGLDDFLVEIEAVVEIEN